MIRVFVVYEAEPNAEWYEQHAQLCQQVPGATFRHGKVFGAPMGEPMYRYYAEWEFPDRDVQGRGRHRRVHGVGQGRDATGSRSTCTSRTLTEPDYPRPRAPEELGLEKVIYEKAPPRATITLNRPEVLNAFDFQLLRELARACEDASWDDEIRVVVLTGAGRAFCVGADLRSWAENYLGKPTEYWKWFGAFKDAHDRLREIGKPTVARINGICVGGGNELQMACDLAVIVDDTYIRHVGPEHGSVPAARPSGCRSSLATAAPARSSSSARRSQRAAPKSGVLSTAPSRPQSSTVKSIGPSRASLASFRRPRATRSST